MRRGRRILLVMGGAALTWGLVVGYEVLTRRMSPLANKVEAFAQEGPGATKLEVTVYALEPRRNELKGDEDPNHQLAQVTAAHFHQYPILKAQAVSDAALATEVVRGVVEGMRRRASGYKCFDPRHGLRITRGGEHVDLVICYECELVEVWGLGGAMLGEYHTTSGSSRRVMEKALGGR